MREIVSALPRFLNSKFTNLSQLVSDSEYTICNILSACFAINLCALEMWSVPLIC